MKTECCPPFALTRPAFPEMTSVAACYAPRIPGAVLMRFTPDDDFYDDDDIADLPDCAVALLARAGSWSARKSKNGSVSASMLAQLSSDPAQAAEELCKRGIWRRGKRGGYQFTDWERWAEAAEDVKQREAAAERKRELGRERAQRKRDRDKAIKAEVMAEGVTRYVTRYDDAAEENPQAGSPDVTRDIEGPSRSPVRDVTRPEGTGRKKPQVNDGHVTRYEAGSSRVTAKTGTSDDQDKDPDQNQSSGVNQSNGRAREAPSPGTVAFAAAGCSKKLKRTVTEAEACRAIDIWDRRAEAAGKVVHEPEKFYLTCIRRENDLEAILAPPVPAPPPEWLELGRAPDSAPGAHVFEPPGDPFDTACSRAGCGLPEKNTRVHLREANTG